MGKASRHPTYTSAGAQNFSRDRGRYSESGWSEWRPAPELNTEMNYVHTGKYRPIKVYTSVDTRFILEEFFAKLAIFTRKREGKETPSTEGLDLITKYAE
jgi:hypothetical protein